MPPNQGKNPSGYTIITSLRDLQRKYLRDKDVIHSTWISLSLEQRKEVILAGSSEGETSFLRYRDDSRLGRTRYIIPELNLHDLMLGEALLDLLDLRATTSIREIYPADARFMLESMHVNGIRHANARMSGAVITFMDEDSWGDGFEVSIDAPPDTFENLIRMGKGHVRNENEGLMILQRQVYIYTFLTIVVDDILDMKRLIEDPDANKRLPKRARPVLEQFGSSILASNSSHDGKPKQKNRPSKPVKKAPRPPSREEQLSRLAANARTALYSTEDHISLLRGEPLYFSNIASQFFFSTPGRVPDNADITELINTAATATTAVLELLKDAYTAHTYWRYISTLTSSYPSLATEIWAACNKELLRARGVFRRFVATEPKYTRFFVRTTYTDPETSPSPELAFKAPLETIPKKSQFTFWILSLTDATQLSYRDVATLLQQMDAFVELVPTARQNISGGMGGALADIAVITAFMERFQGVWGALGEGPEFVGRIERRVEELGELWKRIDLAEWAWPVDNLKGKEAAVGCWVAVEAGLKGGLEQVFGGVVDECVKELMGEEVVVAPPKLDETEAPPELTEPTPAPAAPKPKEQSVPSPSSTTTIIASPSALKTFRKIFRPGSGGGIPWPTFVSAMTTIGFGVESIGGSVSRFRPPEGGGHPVNIHRPHPTDRFEGWALLKLRKRLERCYGWKAETFVAMNK